jgi:hypothetical protein
MEKVRSGKSSVFKFKSTLPKNHYRHRSWVLWGLAKRATIPVSIRERLCIGCQVIRWDVAGEFEDAERWGALDDAAEQLTEQLGKIVLMTGSQLALRKRYVFYLNNSPCCFTHASACK